MTHDRFTRYILLLFYFFQYKVLRNANTLTTSNVKYLYIYMVVEWALCRSHSAVLPLLPLSSQAM